MILGEIVLVSIVGGVIALDRTVAFQFMISRPIVAAPVIGAILGEPMVGLKAGLFVELLWIGDLPVGASVPPDETVVSVLVTAVTVWCTKLLQGAGDEVIGLTIAFVIPAAIVAQRIDFKVRQMNIASAHAADSMADNMDFKGVQRECIKGIGRFWAGYTLMFLVLLPVGVLSVLFVYPVLPEFVLTGLRRFSYIIPVIGVASVIAAMRVRNAVGFVLISFVVALGLAEVFGVG